MSLSLALPDVYSWLNLGHVLLGSILPTRWFVLPCAPCQESQGRCLSRHWRWCALVTCFMEVSPPRSYCFPLWINTHLVEVFPENVCVLFSLHIHPSVLVSINDFCLKKLLLWWKPNGYFLVPLFLLYLLAGIPVWGRVFLLNYLISISVDSLMMMIFSVSYSALQPWFISMLKLPWTRRVESLHTSSHALWSAPVSLSLSTPSLWAQ